MLDAAPGIEQYIFCSSAGVYLKSDQMPHREEDAVDPKSRHKACEVVFNYMCDHQFFAKDQAGTNSFSGKWLMKLNNKVAHFCTGQAQHRGPARQLRHQLDVHSASVHLWTFELQSSRGVVFPTHSRGPPNPCAELWAAGDSAVVTFCDCQLSRLPSDRG